MHATCLCGDQLGKKRSSRKSEPLIISLTIKSNRNDNHVAALQNQDTSSGRAQRGVAPDKSPGADFLKN